MPPRPQLNVSLTLHGEIIYQAKPRRRRLNVCGKKCLKTAQGLNEGTSLMIKLVLVQLLAYAALFDYGILEGLE